MLKVLIEWTVDGSSIDWILEALEVTYVQKQYGTAAGAQILPVDGLTLGNDCSHTVILFFWSLLIFFDQLYAPESDLKHTMVYVLLHVQILFIVVYSKRSSSILIKKIWIKPVSVKFLVSVLNYPWTWDNTGGWYRCVLARSGLTLYGYLKWLYKWNKK